MLILTKDTSTIYIPVNCQLNARPFNQPCQLHVYHFNKNVGWFDEQTWSWCLFRWKRNLHKYGRHVFSYPVMSSFRWWLNACVLNSKQDRRQKSRHCCMQGVVVGPSVRAHTATLVQQPRRRLDAVPCLLLLKMTSTWLIRYFVVGCLIKHLNRVGKLWLNTYQISDS